MLEAVTVNGIELGLTGTIPNMSLDPALDPAIVDQVYCLLGQLKTRGQIVRHLQTYHGIGRELAGEYWRAAVAQCREDFEGSLEDVRSWIANGLIQAIQGATDSERWEAVFKGYDLLARVQGVTYSYSDMIKELSSNGYSVTQLEIPGLHGQLSADPHAQG